MLKILIFLPVLILSGCQTYNRHYTTLLARDVEGQLELKLLGVSGTDLNEKDAANILFDIHKKDIPPQDHSKYRGQHKIVHFAEMYIPIKRTKDWVMLYPVIELKPEKK